MPRLRSLTLEKFDPELRAMLKADQKSDREMRPTSVRAHRPEFAKAHVRFMAAFREHTVVSTRLRELVRLRFAFHNQCRSCMAMRYADALDAGGVSLSVTHPVGQSRFNAGDAVTVSFAGKDALLYANGVFARDG